jgi:hypothetical protein
MVALMVLTLVVQLDKLLAVMMAAWLGLMKAVQKVYVKAEHWDSRRDIRWVGLMVASTVLMMVASLVMMWVVLKVVY